MTPARQRAIDLERLSAERWDLLVVGGGIVGVGAALDAALRGARVALVERDDLGSGTSSRSSKLIHGGLRYLEHFHLGLVHEALRERRVLLRLAPHLVRLEPFLVPIYGSPLQLPYIGAGLALYGALGAARDGGWPRYLSTKAAIARAPGLRTDRLRGAFVYTDGVEDDARLLVAVARTAARAGALVVTRVDAEALSAGDDPVTVRDCLRGDAIRVHAARVLDATGPSRPDEGVLPSRGTHIVVERERIESQNGMTLRVPGRVIFVIPWQRHWIIGTTDVPHEDPTARPAATSEEVDYLLEHVNAALRVSLTRDDVVATYAGIRPLAVSGRRGRPPDTAHASREHRVARQGRLVSVRGGKYTTYRVIARDAVDVALGRHPKPDLTRTHRLVGSADPEVLHASVDRLRRRHRLTIDEGRRLVARHGAEATDLAELAAERGTLRPLGQRGGYLEGEVTWAVEREWALSVDDVLARRTRLALEARDHGASVADRVAAILGESLGWESGERRGAVGAYRVQADQEYGVPGRPPRKPTEVPA